MPRNDETVVAADCSVVADGIIKNPDGAHRGVIGSVSANNKKAIAMHRGVVVF